MQGRNTGLPIFFFCLSFQACLRDGSQYRKWIHDNESTVESESVKRREALFIAQDIMACILSSFDVQL